MAILNP